MANFCKKCGKKISGGDYCSDHSSSDASGSISNVSQNQQLDSSSGHYQPIGVLPSNGGFADRLSAAHVPFGNQTQSAFHPWRRYFAR